MVLRVVHIKVVLKVLLRELRDGLEGSREGASERSTPIEKAELSQLLHL
jgi:hypothetical protein